MAGSYSRHVNMDITDRILITGAGGFVGTNLTKYLHEFGYLNIVPVAKADADLTKLGAIIDLFDTQQPDYVFHLAAHITGYRRTPEEDELDFRTNQLINMNVVKACMAVNVKKVVAMGSVLAYPGTPSPTPRQESTALSDEKSDVP